MSTPFVPPFGGSSVLESPLQLASAGPAPGVQVIEELEPGFIQWTPLSAYGFTAYLAGTLIDDAYWAQWASNYLVIKYGSGVGSISGGGGGEIHAGPFTYSLMTQLTLNQQPLNQQNANKGYTSSVSLKGKRGATILNQFGSTGLYFHRPQQGYNLFPSGQNNNPNQMCDQGFIHDVILDGAGAPVGAIGVDCGDGWGGNIDMTIRNFVDETGTAQSSIGLYEVNRTFWTEKWRYRLTTINCDNHIVRDTLPGSGGNNSHEYCDFDWYSYQLGGANTPTGNGQKGLVVQNASSCGGGAHRWRGNHGGGGMGGSGGSFATILDTSSYFNATYDIVVEGNGSTQLPTLLNVAAGANFSGHGHIMPQFAGWAPSIIAGKFGVSGNVGRNDTGLQGSFSLPGSGTPFTYRGADIWVYLTGGTITGLVHNGVTKPAATFNLPFMLRDNNAITVTYGPAPTVTVVPVTV